MLTAPSISVPVSEVKHTLRARVTDDAIQAELTETPLCRVEKRGLREDTTTTTREARSPLPFVFAALGAAAFGAAGGYFVGTAASRPDIDDGYSRDELSTQGSLGIGIPGLTIAVGLAALFVVDMARTRDGTEVAAPVEVVLSSSITPCGKPRPSRGKEIALYLPSSPPRIEKQKTDSTGTAVFQIPVEELGSIEQNEIVGIELRHDELKFGLQLADKAIYVNAREEVKRRAKEAAAQAKREAERERRLAEDRHLAELKKLGATLLKRPVPLYLSEENITACSLPALEEECPGEPSMLIDLGPHLVIAATRTHHGIAAEDAEAPFSFKDIVFWVRKAEMITKRMHKKREADWARREKLEARRELARQKREERKEKRRAKREAIRAEKQRKSWARRFRAVVSMKRTQMSWAMKTRDENKQALMLNAVGYGKPGGGTSYYDAVKRLQRGATDSNILAFLVEVRSQYGAGQEGCLAIFHLLGIPLKMAEMLFTLLEEAPQDALP